MSNPEAEVGKPPVEVTRTGADTPPVVADPLDQYRYSGPPEDAIRRTSGGDTPERVEFRKQAEQKLAPVVTDLEGGRDAMTALHKLVKDGKGPGTKEYDDAFKAAKQSYFGAIDKASKMLYDQDSEGRLTPNKFYQDVEKERAQLQAEMKAAKATNPAEFERLSKQNAMLGDVLRANGYAHANFGMALERSSVYLPKDQRDKQMDQGQNMLRLASRYDKWMMGDPPNVPPDPNFMKHQDAIMKAVNSTPYVAARPGEVVPPGPTTDVPVPPGPGPVTTADATLPAGYTRRTAGAMTFIDGNEVSVPTGNVVLKGDGTTADPNDPLALMNAGKFAEAILAADKLDKVPLITQLEKLKAALPGQQKALMDALAAAEADPRNPLNRYAIETKKINGEQAANKAKVSELGKAGTTEQQQALAQMWQNVQSTADLAKFLSSTDPAIKAVADAVKAHPKFAEINSTFGQFLNNKTKLAALEQGLGTNPATKAFADSKTAYLQGVQQADYLTALYISPISARELRVQQLSQHAGVVGLIAAPDKAAYIKAQPADSENAKAIAEARQRVNELINLQAKPPQPLVDLQKAMGDATAAPAPVPGPGPTTEVTPPIAPPVVADGGVIGPPQPEVARTNDSADIPPELAAKVAPLQNVEKAFTGAATAFGEVASLQKFATEVKLLREFDTQVKALKDNERTPEKIAEIQTKVFAGNEYMAAVYSPKERPNLATEVDKAIQESQARNFGNNQYLAQKYSLQARPNLKDEVALDPTGKYLKEMPTDVKAFFEQANKILGENSPEKIQEMVTAQRGIYQARLDKMVPKAEQQPITDQLNTLQSTFDKAMEALDPRVRGALATTYADLQTTKGQIGGKYLQAMPQFQSDLQAVINGTPQNSPARQQALVQLQSKYMGQVEANPEYQKEVKAAEDQAFTQLKSLDQNTSDQVDAVLAAQRGLDDFVAGKDGTPNQDAASRQARADKIAAMDGFMTATKDLDALAHSTAVVQSYQARTLLLTADPANHAKALELMTASTGDPAAAQYLALPQNEAVAAQYMLAAAGQVMQGSAPVELFGSMVPGTGGLARGLADLTGGTVLGSRLENANAATLALAEGGKYDPVFTQAQIAAATAAGEQQGNGLKRDVGSLLAYGGTYGGLSLLPRLGVKALPGPLKVVAGMVVAGGTSDYLEDGKLDGPLNAPGAWIRGGGVGLGGHFAYNTLVGKWSTTALSETASARLAALGGESAIKVEGNWAVRTWAGVKGGTAAYLNPANTPLRVLSEVPVVNRLPFVSRLANPLLTEAAITAADGPALLAMQRSLGATAWYNTVGTAFTIGAGSQGLKIVDGKAPVTGVKDALTQMGTVGGFAALTSGVLVPAATMIPKWGLGKVPGVNTLLESRAAGMIYAFGRTYAADFGQANSDATMAKDLKVAYANSQNPEELWKVLQKANEGMSETEAKARALMVVQMQRGQTMRRAPK